MKYFVFVLLFAITTFLTAEEYPIMMQIKTDLKISEDFRGGVESGLTENSYSLVSEEDQNQTLKEQATQRKKECYDESCLVDVGKMLAAKGLVMVEVTKKDDKSYLFKAKYIDFETGTTQKTVTEYFEYELKNYKELNKFGKKLIKGMFGKNETTNKEIIKEIVIKDNSKTETNSAGKVKIEFTTTPNRVEVYDSNNNLLGETPFFVNLPKGFTKFSFEKKGFNKVLKEIHIKQDEIINISLTEKIYNLEIDTNVNGAIVYIDGKEKGKTPFSAKLNEGIYSVKLEKEEYDTYSEEIPLKKDVEKTITLNKNIFELTIKSNVEDSKVYIDSILKGKTPYTIKLSKGNHTIKLTKDEYEDKEKTFFLNNDKTETFTLNTIEKIIQSKTEKTNQNKKRNEIEQSENKKDEEFLINFSFGIKWGLSIMSFSGLEKTGEINDYHAGIFFTLYFNRLFFQSEVIYDNYSAEIKLTPIIINYLTIPILFGVKVIEDINEDSLIQFYTGLGFSSIKDKNLQFTYTNYGEEEETDFVEFSSFDIGWIVGILTKYKTNNIPTFLDLRYSKNISNNFKNHLNNIFTFSLGLIF